jgi:hypothetical protein
VPQSIVSLPACSVKLAGLDRGWPAILLAMEIDPAAEWRRLTEVYREKYDGELLELAAVSADLTEIAQRVLRDEMQRRKLSLPQPNGPRPGEPRRNESFEAADRRQIKAAADRDADTDVDGPRDYTWKVNLCEYTDPEQAYQIYMTLERAGIQSWVERRFPGSIDLGGPRIAVAADQLDQARAVLAQPIPQDIIDESMLKVPEYEPPACPECGAEDPMLESADPVNAWECEQCGAQWTDAAEDAPAEP